MKNDPNRCDKRQREITKGVEEFRCLDRKAADTYLEIVDVPTCESCLVLAAKIEREGSCERHWSEELLSIKAVANVPSGVNTAEAQLGFEQPCHHRWDGKCRITGHTISPEICKACDQETADHMATLPEMGVGFVNEVKVWIREGRPVRTQEEVGRILKICKGDPDSPDPEKREACKMYDPVKEACKKCGCAMNNSSWALRNGIKMKTKICPMGLWR